MDTSNAYKSVLFLLAPTVVVCGGMAGWGYEPRVCMTLLLVDTVTLELETKVFTKKTPSRAFSWLKVDIYSTVSRGEIGTPTQLS